MNIALIIAGGSGQRMNQDIPKQFINVRNKPVIIYTLEVFQNHPDLDAIYVVCIDGWHEILRAYAKQFNITKLAGIVSGGETGQASIYNGLVVIKEDFADEDIVLVHDAIRPMVSEEIISDNIAVCRLHGSAVTSISCAEALLETESKVFSNSIYDREKIMRTQTPQAFPLGKLAKVHKEALRRGITNSVASCTLMIELGHQVHFSAGSEKNIKLTTIDDIEIFKALLSTKNSDWLK
ncbi:IspD/TarI family cytidylyltransferase [Paenibacillus sp. FSL H8-0332]|uniref:IspD/TarI family cytidylyltransferase n=1 Tax=Paenibacillus sp. FSL H8-0332 TaxID=2954742 RepID=UPI0030CF4FFE